MPDDLDRIEERSIDHIGGRSERDGPPPTVCLQSISLGADVEAEGVEAGHHGDGKRVHIGFRDGRRQECQVASLLGQPLVNLGLVVRSGKFNVPLPREGGVSVGPAQDHELQGEPVASGVVQAIQQDSRALGPDNRSDDGDPNPLADSMGRDHPPHPGKRLEVGPERDREIGHVATQPANGVLARSKNLPGATEVSGETVTPGGDRLGNAFATVVPMAVQADRANLRIRLTTVFLIDAIEMTSRADRIVVVHGPVVRYTGFLELSQRANGAIPSDDGRGHESVPGVPSGA